MGQAQIRADEHRWCGGEKRNTDKPQRWGRHREEWVKMVKESSANYANFANGESKDTYHGAHGEYGGLGDTRNDNAKKRGTTKRGVKGHVSRVKGQG